jgi:hypothetical protein
MYSTIQKFSKNAVVEGTTRPIKACGQSKNLIPRESNRSTGSEISLDKSCHSR